MKRSRSIKLALMGAGALTLTACSQKEEAAVYETVEQCAEAGVFDAETCAQQFEQAQTAHLDVAPRYVRPNDCYNDFGYQQCQRYRARDGSSFFVPFMLGYMFAPRGRSSVYTQPLYRSADDPNTFRTARNRQIASVGADGQTTVAKSTGQQPRVRTRTVSRGGFGARAARSSAG